MLFLNIYAACVQSMTSATVVVDCLFMRYKCPLTSSSGSGVKSPSFIIDSNVISTFSCAGVAFNYVCNRFCLATE